MPPRQKTQYNKKPNDKNKKINQAKKLYNKKKQGIV